MVNNWSYFSLLWDSLVEQRRFALADFTSTSPAPQYTYWMASSASLQTWVMLSTVSTLPWSPLILFIGSMHLFSASLCFASHGFVKGYVLFFCRTHRMNNYVLEQTTASNFKVPFFFFFSLLTPKSGDALPFPDLLTLSLYFSKWGKEPGPCPTNILVSILLCTVTTCTATYKIYANAQGHERFHRLSFPLYL